MLNGVGVLLPLLLLLMVMKKGGESWSLWAASTASTAGGVSRGSVKI